MRALRLCSTSRSFKEALEKVTVVAMRRGFGIKEQQRTWTKFLRLWWGAPEVAMGEIQVWFGRMTKWVRTEVQKEEVKTRRCWDGWDCKKMKCPYVCGYRRKGYGICDIVFIVGEGIHFILDDSVRLMAQLNRANIIAAKLGLRTYRHWQTQQHAIPQTTTNTQGRGYVGEKREW